METNDPPSAKQNLGHPGAHAAPPRPAEDLLAEAMACVTWDGTVDTDRLVSVEFAHDEAVVRRVVGLAAMTMDSRTDAEASLRHNCMTIGGVAVDDGWESCPFVVVRGGGAWRVETPATVDDKRMTDEDLIVYCALAARGPLFSMLWSVPAEALECVDHCGDDDNKSPTDAGWCIEWRSMWMSRVIGALAAASGAWTGDEVMRTQTLARALAGILRERNTKGPLDGRDQARPTSPHDPVEPAGLRKAISIASHMPAGIEFDWATDVAPIGTTRDAAHALAILHFVITATERVYETQSLYTQMILPAEYDALQRNTPTGAFE